MKKRIKRHPFNRRIKRRLRFVYLKIIRLSDPPERIARGVAIGVLMGILPTFGLGVFLSLGAAFAFRANKAAAVLGSMIMNPFTSPFFWGISAAVGSFIMREDRAELLIRLRGADGESILKNAGWLTAVYMTGNVVVSAVFTVISYYLVKIWVSEHRRHKAAKKKAG
ncbi:MAG: DUF2062 domain-containing protein [Deltaproteobacteria bacterium]|nr:DUF2062 domain-containing protein [Deltaproteobacteria bacterium]